MHLTYDQELEAPACEALQPGTTCCLHCSHHHLPARMCYKASKGGMSGDQATEFQCARCCTRLQLVSEDIKHTAAACYH